MNKLMEMRTSAGLSRPQLSKLSGINLRSIEAYEQGKCDINGAKIKTVLKLSEALGCRMRDILDDEELIRLLDEDALKYK